MNISEVSTQLHELSDSYSTQRITFDEYRLKRKSLLDEIDQTLNQQCCEITPQCDEKVGEPSHESGVMSEIITPRFNADKKHDNTGAID